MSDLLTSADGVSLAPMTEDDLRLFEDALRGPEGTGPFQWFGHRDGRRLRARWNEDGLLGDGGGLLAIRAGDRSCGRVEWFAQAWGPVATSTCWTIAIGVDADHRGRGIGTTAQRLLVAYLFAHSRAERIQAYADVENVAERIALARAGFTEEGVLRRAQWRDGAWHDMVLFAAVRGEGRAG